MTYRVYPKQTGQLPFHLPLEAANARDDLVVSEANHHAVEFLDSWPQWPTKIAIISGDKGAGKSHLAQIWAANAQARFLQTNRTVQEPDANRQQTGNFVVENISQGSFNEVWLFHLLNSAMNNDGSVLLTSRRTIDHWGIALSDLYSRLRSAHKMSVAPPDDKLLVGVLVKLFSDRQMQVNKGVIEYMILHMERSLAFALKLVEKIDEESLSDKRAVTRSLVAKVINEMNGGDS